MDLFILSEGLTKALITPIGCISYFVCRIHWKSRNSPASDLEKLSTVGILHPDNKTNTVTPTILSELEKYQKLPEAPFFA